jgi:L-alanine-DL-glutamate epimerase-like enolase superfamily enzyme
LVKVRGKDGNEGIGFCYVGSAGGDIAKIAVEQLLAPKLIGQNSHRSEGLWMDMYNESICKGARVLLCAASPFWIRRFGI